MRGSPPWLSAMLNDRCSISPVGRAPKPQQASDTCDIVTQSVQSVQSAQTHSHIRARIAVRKEYRNTITGVRLLFVIAICRSHPLESRLLSKSAAFALPERVWEKIFGKD